MPVSSEEDGASQTRRNRPQLLERPRLLRAIADADGRIVALVAPAGYGKTVLARQWADTVAGDALWYSASSRSGDVAALANDLLNLLQVPHELASTARDALRARRPNRVTARVAAGVVAQSLAARPPGSWLIVDDYHLLGGDDACESFVETLVERSPVPLLLATRERPRWLTSRRRIYSEVLEVTAQELAMTEEEVAAALGGTSGRPTFTWRELAEGWPAVVGLASYGRTEALPQGQVAEALYAFFASELYASLTDELQGAARLLAIPERLTPLVCRFLVGEDYGAVLDDLETAGFVTADGPPSIHPLLRGYLRLLGRSDTDFRATADRLSQFLIQARAYDDAFAVLEAHDQPTLVPTLLHASFRELLSGGRDATLERWIALARTARIDDSVVDLVEAELAFRRGDLARADTLAQRSASRDDDGLARGRAYLVAARAAHMRSDERAAYDLLQRALGQPIDQRDRSDLEWHQFILACELELPEASDLLHSYGRSASASFDEHVRFLNGKGVLASQFGGIGDVLLQPREIMDLARHTTEPVIRCGFMNRYALLLWAQAHYAEALRVIEAELEALRTGRLDFAVPHALALRAAIEVGLRRYRTAESTIRRVLSLQPSDAYLKLEITCTRARALCAQRRARDAAMLTAASLSEPPNRAVYGEYITTRALALAVSGAPEAALEASAEAREITVTRETHVRAAFAEAVVASVRGDDAPLRLATAAAWKTGQLEPLVSSYRAFPNLLGKLNPEDPHYVDVLNLVDRLGDERCARAGGLRIDESRFGRLTKRETEVLDLLTDGLSNKEIAKHLYITEVTAKLHVSRVLSKLGVSSRTKAAIRALEQRGYDADATASDPS